MLGVDCSLQQHAFFNPEFVDSVLPGIDGSLELLDCPLTGDDTFLELLDLALTGIDGIPGILGLRCGGILSLSQSVL